MKKIFLFILLTLFVFPSIAFARISADDIYQSQLSDYNSQLNKLPLAQRQKVKQAQAELTNVNQKVCSRFDDDVSKLAAVLQEERSRQGLSDKPTVVAYGQGNTPLENAEYWVNYAEEAVAYQKNHYYLPQVGSRNAVSAVTSSMNGLSGDLGVLKSKILHAKSQVQEVIANAK